MSKKVTNDQGHIIEAIRKKNYIYAWENVKYVGYDVIRDMNERMMLFFEIVQDFDCEKNNNFIKFYLTRLNYCKLDKNETFVFTKNRKIIKELKAEDISPSETTKSPTVNELKNWNL